MRDLKKYWASVRELQREFEAKSPGGLRVATIKNEDFGRPGGVVSIALPELAARLVTDGSHRLASEQEISEFEAMHARRGALLGAKSRDWARSNREPGQKAGVDYAI
jgi:hypothetical protein